MGNILKAILYRPLGWILSLCYRLFSSYGIALLLVAILLRIILFPSTLKQQKGMAKNARMQAKVQKIRKKYATNQKRMQEETNALYQREGFNPLSGGCLPMLIQFPIMLILYGIVYRPFTYIAYAPADVIEKATAAVKALPKDVLGKATIAANNAEVYIYRFFDNIKSSVPALEKYYNTLGDKFFHFLGLDLSMTPNIKEINFIWLIPILAAVTSFALSFYQMKGQNQQNPEMAKTSGCMNYSIPLISLFFCFSMPAAVGFYWICTNIAMLLQTIFMNKFYPPQDMLGKMLIEETIKRRSYESVRKNKINASAAEQ